MKKIVFLPCSPDMWDGLQTLWEDAVKDPDNHVIVMPIPTYKRYKDNHLSDIEYSPESYPEELHVVGVNDYNFAAEMPDTIYIQCAADLGTLGFCVHEFFFTYNLKKFTGDLVYVPYTCFDEAFIDDEKYLEDIRGQMLPRGIDFVDRVIVQSRKMKNVMVSEIAMGNKELAAEWEQKISWEEHPRTQLVKRMKKDTVSYPKEWDNVLFDTDGNRKETVLLCTSVFHILEGNRPAINEVKELLSTYIENKDKKALIWRPHRKMLEVLNILRPELIGDFEGLLSFFRENSIGILDDTPSPTAALVLSNSYAGDNCGIGAIFANAKPAPKEA